MLTNRSPGNNLYATPLWIFSVVAV